ncbi:hypothetical protein TI05_09700 [Achromatium sp. WMS3]|nr:hypothetical protein TI05_09700 [Achromatium sp. WMS3]
MSDIEGVAHYAREGNAWFITLSGKVTYSLGPAINALLDKALSEPSEQRFVIDLSNVDNIDSTCLGIFARIVNQPNKQYKQRPVIITGGEDIQELLLAICFDWTFDLVESVNIDNFKDKLHLVPDINLNQTDMLSLLLESHKRLCAMDAKNHAVFKDVVDALESDLANQSI